MKIAIKSITAILLSSLLLSSCTGDEDSDRQLAGAVGGAAIGGIIGSSIGDDDAGGAIIGATAGAALGSYLASDRRYRRSERYYYDDHRERCMRRRECYVNRYGDRYCETAYYCRDGYR